MRDVLVVAWLTVAMLLPSSTVLGYSYGGSAGETLAATTVRGTLNATVGPGFTITIKKKSGVVVKKLRAGTWRIVVDDKSSVHNFHLSGQGVNKATTVSEIRKVTWTVTFAKGKTYTYVCDPHSGSMRGQFSIRTD